MSGNGESFDLADAASRYAILKQQQLTEGERLTALYNSWIRKANDTTYPRTDVEIGERNQARRCAEELLMVIRP